MDQKDYGVHYLTRLSMLSHPFIISELFYHPVNDRKLLVMHRRLVH